MANKEDSPPRERVIPLAEIDKKAKLPLREVINKEMETEDVDLTKLETKPLTEKPPLTPRSRLAINFDPLSVSGPSFKSMEAYKMYKHSYGIVFHSSMIDFQIAQLELANSINKNWKRLQIAHQGLLSLLKYLSDKDLSDKSVTIDYYNNTKEVMGRIKPHIEAIVDMLEEAEVELTK